MWDSFSNAQSIIVFLYQEWKLSYIDLLCKDMFQSNLDKQLILEEAGNLYNS